MPQVGGPLGAAEVQVNVDYVVVVYGGDGLYGRNEGGGGVGREVGDEGVVRVVLGLSLVAVAVAVATTAAVAVAVQGSKRAGGISTVLSVCGVLNRVNHGGVGGQGAVFAAQEAEGELGGVHHGSQD